MVPFLPSLTHLFASRSTGTRRGRVFALSLLGWELFRAGSVPPVTLSLIGFQVAIFLRLFSFFQNLRLKHICVSAYHVIFGGDYRRLILAPLVHADEWHLYYNMASLLWKGKTLERRLGCPYYAYLTLAFTLCTSIVFVVLNYFMAEIFEDDAHVINCAVGFSGVLFAMKVLTTYMEPPSTTLLLGFIPVSSKWACWAELGLIQVLVPHASFTGHLAGILVGLAYTKGPLKRLLDVPFLSLIGYAPVVHGYESYESYHFAGPSGRRESARNASSTSSRRSWRSSASTTTTTTTGFDEEFDDRSDSVNLDELRRRRAQRFL